MNRMIAVFPGQGSQHVGMAKDLYDSFRLVRDIFEEASDAIHVDLKKLCFEGPESDLVLTENTQPCLLVASISAYWVAHREFGFTPSAVAGHSLGEYTALVAAQAFPLATAVRLVRERGAAMQAAVPAGEGAMTAILGLQEEGKITTLCQVATELAQSKRQAASQQSWKVQATAEPANFNAPGQVVIAGSKDAIDEAIELTKKKREFKGAKAIPLSVSAPFHCQLMRPAKERMKQIFSQLKATERPNQTLPFPYIPNRTGRLIREPGIVLELLIEQVDHPVLWSQSIAEALAQGMSLQIEFGPGKVLSGLAKRIVQAAAIPCSMLSVNDTASMRNLETELKKGST